MKNIINHVLPWDYCCNCGICSAVCPTNCLKMQLTEVGEYRPVLHKGNHCVSCGLCLDVCPYSGAVEENEETIGLELFGNQEEFQYHKYLGWFHQTYYGAVVQENLRFSSPSGGLTNAILRELFRERKITGAMVTQPLAESPWFQFQMVHSAEEVQNTGGSVYHTITPGPIIREILNTPDTERFAVTALPCVVHALRLAQKKLPRLREKIPYILSLVCGGCSTLHRANLISVMLRDNKAGICYRNKRNAADTIDTSVTTALTQTPYHVKVKSIFGFFILHGIGNLNSCILCNDLYSCMADSTSMEAFVPPFISDARGTNFIISRNKDISEILEGGITKGYFQGGVISPEKVFMSQKSNAVERFETARAAYWHEKRARPYGNSMPCKCQAITQNPTTEKEEKVFLKRLQLHTQTRRYLRHFSEFYSNPQNWYCRLYVWRLLWKFLYSVWQCGFLKKNWEALKEVTSLLKESNHLE